MNKWRQALLLTCCLCLALGAGLVLADSMKIKDIIERNTKIRGQELTVVGEISAITHRETMGLYVVDLNKSNSENADSAKGSSETSIYLVIDETASIYVLSTKHYEEKDKAEFTACVLMNSKDKVGNDQVLLYDRHISAKQGLTSPSYSKFMLEDLLKRADLGKTWVLLIDVGVEGNHEN